MKNSWIIFLAAMSLLGANALAQAPRQAGSPQDPATRNSQNTPGDQTIPGSQQTPDSRNPPGSANAPDTQNAPEASEPAISSADRKFVQQAAEGGMAEVAAGKLAQEQGQSAQVKEIANSLVEDHTKANDELKQIAAAEGIDLPADAGMKHQNALAKLEQEPAEDFDRSFLRQQEKMHRQALSRFEKAAERSENQAIKQFAAKTVPSLREHLDAIEQASAASEAAADAASGASGSAPQQ